MRRIWSVVALVIVAGGPGVVRAEWAERLFEERSYDFGTVAGGTDARHAFLARNIYGEPVRIAGFVVACGCTEVKVGGRVVRPSYPNQRIMLPEAERIVLEPGEQVAIELALDTKKFAGQHKTTSVTVIFDRPSYSRVRLRMSAYIRQDVVANPGIIAFGPVVQGQTPNRSVEIEYAGGLDWRIHAIEWDARYFTVEAEELYRRSRRVGYRITVALKPDAPVGIIREELLIRTNDPASPELAIPIEGSVQPPILLTPTTLSLGNVKVGEVVHRTLVVRGNKAFVIKEVKVDAPDVTVTFAQGKEARLHLLKLRFEPTTAGEREATVVVVTDRDEVTPLTAVMRARVEP